MNDTISSAIDSTKNAADVALGVVAVATVIYAAGSLCRFVWNEIPQNDVVPPMPELITFDSKRKKK